MPLKILYLLHQYFPDQTGGTELVARGLVRRMRETGHAVTVFAYREVQSTSPAAYGTRLEQVDGADVYWFNFNLSQHGNPWEAEYHNRFVDAALREVLREVGPDIAHVMHAMKLGGGIFDILGAAGVPIVTTISDYWFICLRHQLLLPDGTGCKTGPVPPETCLHCLLSTHGEVANDPAEALPALAERNVFLRSALLKSHRTIGLTAHVMEVHRRFGISPAGEFLEDHGVEHALLDPVRMERLSRPARDATDALRLLFVGSLVQHKGVHLVIEAMLAEPALPVELRIIGDTASGGNYCSKLQQATVMDGRIEWAGQCAPEVLATHYQWCDALVFPSMWDENAPLVFKEARYCGIPVAAHDIDGLNFRGGDADFGWTIPEPVAGAWQEWLKEAIGQTRRYLPAEGAIPTAAKFAERMLFHYREVLAQ